MYGHPIGQYCHSHVLVQHRSAEPRAGNTLSGNAYCHIKTHLLPVLLDLHPCLSCSFWGVFFVGYISRPAGAVLFGHLGDTKGRSLCLLISVLVMGIPTVSTSAAAQQDAAAM